MRYHIDATSMSLNHYGEELCGDMVEIHHTDEFDLMILADGMGSGVKANILATLTSKILATMFLQGAKLEYDCKIPANLSRKTSRLCNIFDFTDF